ncbi:hypothetical protein [Aquariibacter albus]|nr:hypothetical protein [Aquariibacter albus]
MSRRAGFRAGGLALTMLLGLAACGDRPQELAAGQKRPDAPSWQGEASGFAVPGWQANDRASWEQQIRTRNQRQNEYARIAQ